MKRLLLLSALLNFAVANGVFATEVFIHIDPLDFEEDSSKEEESIKDSALDSPKGEESSSDSMLDSSKKEKSSSELTHQQSAIQPQASNVFEAVRNGDLARVKALVEEDCKNINVTDSDGNTPLHIASMQGHSDIITYLIGEVYCSVDKKNNDRKTALDVAKNDTTKKFLQTEISKFLQKIEEIYNFNEQLNIEAEKEYKRLHEQTLPKKSWFRTIAPTLKEEELAPIIYIEQMKKCKQKTEELLNMDFEDVYSLKINGKDAMPIQILNLLKKIAIANYNIRQFASHQYTWDLFCYRENINYNTAKEDCLKKAKELGMNLDIEQLEKSPVFAMFTVLCVLDYTDKIRKDIILRCIENSDIFFKYARDLLEKTPMKHDLLLQKALRVLAMIGHKEAIELLGGDSKDVEIVDNFKADKDIMNIIQENSKIDKEYLQTKGTSKSYDDNPLPEMDKNEPKKINNKIKYAFKFQKEWPSEEWTSTVTIPLPVRKTFIGRHNTLAEIWKMRKSELGEKTYGWKIHISAYPNTAKKVMEIVLQAMKDQDYNYKAISNIEILRGFMLKCIYKNGLSQAGKFITIYTESDEEAKSLVNAIEKGFKAAHLHGIKDFPPCVGEFQVGDTGGIFVRWSPDYTGNKESEDDIIRKLPLVKTKYRLDEEFAYDQIPEKHPFDQELTFLGMKIDRNHFKKYVLPEEVEDLYRYLALDKDMKGPTVTSQEK